MSANNTYADYLVQQQAQQAAQQQTAQQQTAQTGNTGAAPAGYGDYLMKTYKPTTTVAGSYGQWLENRAKNMQIENTPQNAKSYADYLLSLGGNPVGNYNAQVKSANAQYDRARASYGQAAEKLAKAGLSGSGYGDYLEGLAYSQRAADISAAQQNAQNEMKQGFASYADYLENLKAQNEQSAINGILQGLLTGEDARTYAKNMNVTNDRLDYILSQTEPQVQAQKQAQAQQEAAKKQAALQAVSEAVASTGSVNAAKVALANSGIEDLEGAVAQYQQTVVAQYNTAITAATQVTDWATELKQQRAAGNITQEDYDTIVKAASAKNLELINNLRVNHDTTGLAEYINGLAKLDKDGNVKKGKSGIEQWNKLKDDKKGEKIADWVDEMYENGMLTLEDRQAFFSTMEAENVESAVKKANNAFNMSEGLQTRLDNGQISQEQYNELKSKLSDVVEEKYNVTDVGQADSWSSESGDIIDISYKIGGQAFTITLDKKMVAKGSGFVAGKSVPITYTEQFPKGTGKKQATVVFGTINGTPVYRIDDQSGSRYYYVTTDGHKSFLAYMALT